MFNAQPTGISVDPGFDFRAADPGFDSHMCRGDFSGSSLTSGLTTGTPVAPSHRLVLQGQRWDWLPQSE